MTILPQLERDLLDAATKRLPDGDRTALSESSTPARWPRFQRRLRTAVAPVPLLASVLVTLAVAAAALTLAGHHARSTSASAIGVQAARARLIEHFGILRRPQTTADLDPTFISRGMFSDATRPVGRSPGFERVLARWGFPKLDRSLVRVVDIPAWNAKVAFEPATYQPSSSSRRRSEGLALELWIGTAPSIPPSSDDGTGPRPTSLTTLLDDGLALTGGPPGTGVIDGVVTVPDGVASIALGPIRLRRSPVKVDPSKFGVVRATVRDNIAAFQIPMPTLATRRTYSLVFAGGGIAQTTWFDAAGDAIKHTTTNLDLFITVKGNGALPRPRALHCGKFCQENPQVC